MCSTHMRGQWRGIGDFKLGMGGWNPNSSCKEKEKTGHAKSQLIKQWHCFDYASSRPSKASHFDVSPVESEVCLRVPQLWKHATFCRLFVLLSSLFWKADVFSLHFHLFSFREKEYSWHSRCEPLLNGCAHNWWWWDLMICLWDKEPFNVSHTV